MLCTDIYTGKIPIHIYLKEKKKGQGVAAFNPSTQEREAGGTHFVDQPGFELRDPPVDTLSNH